MLFTRNDSKKRDDTFKGINEKMREVSTAVVRKVLHSCSKGLKSQSFNVSIMENKRPEIPIPAQA